MATAALFAAPFFTTSFFAAPFLIAAFIFTTLFATVSATAGVSATRNLQFGFREFGEEAIGLVQGRDIENRNLRHDVVS